MVKNSKISYADNAWGVTTVTYHNGAAGTSAIYSPYTYRGYYYDHDLGLYYLQSRYYDPVTGRFINADSYVSTGQGLTGYNMFAYCNNNPVMYVDHSGEFPWFALLVIVGCAVVGGIVGNAVANRVEEERSNAQYKNNDNLSDSITQGCENEYTMPTSERIEYIAVGTLIGTATGGTMVSASGVFGSLIIGTATESIKLFGMTGVQTYALGALVRNLVFYGLAPFIDIDESNEEFWEVPEENYQFNNPYIP